MPRPFLTALAFAAMCTATAPAFAQTQPDSPLEHGDTLACKDELSKYAPKLDAMTDRMKHDAAVKQIDLARESLGKHDEKMCMSHVGKAIKLMR